MFTGGTIWILTHHTTTCAMVETLHIFRRLGHGAQKGLILTVLKHPVVVVWVTIPVNRQVKEPAEMTPALGWGTSWLDIWRKMEEK